MRKRFPEAIGWAVSVIVIASVGALIWWKIGGLDGNGLDWTPVSSLLFNEWGDFLAGICGTLALIWVVISTHRQGTELAGQAKELANQTSALNTLGEATKEQSVTLKRQMRHLEGQSDALRDQADALKQSLTGQRIIDEWNDLKLIAETLREILPTEGYPAWTTYDGTASIPMTFTGATREEMNDWSDFRFLLRTAGGLKHPVDRLRKCRAAGLRPVLTKGSRSKIRRAAALCEDFLALVGRQPAHRRHILKEAQVDKWLEHLNEIADPFYWPNAGGGKRT